MKKGRLVLLLTVALGASVFVIASAQAAPPGGADETRGEKHALAPLSTGPQPGFNWLFECTATSGGANTKLDCDDPFPNNEPDIHVDPVNPQHMIASSNDYGSCCDQYYTTFNAGATWSTGNMSIEDPSRTGSDPVTVFDRKHGVALHSSLNYNFTNNGEACDGDVVVSPSNDGGLTWLEPVVVYGGSGCDLSPTQVFNDKEWIVTDNNPHSDFYGRTYLTWSRFVSHNGVYASSAIWESHSDNGGKSWSKAQEISGFNGDLCTFQSDSGPAGQCDEDQFSVPTIGGDGTVYVAFQNSQNQALWESGETIDDQYLLVKSDNGGRAWSKPRFVVGLEDGTRDYPVNVNDRQTLSGYQVRVNSAGNIVAVPGSGQEQGNNQGNHGNDKLYLVFSDNRNGVHDSAHPVTNTDVFVVSSSDEGRTWTNPVRVDSGAGDQWFPWVDYNPVTRKIGITYHDRGASNGPLYTTALAEGLPGSFVKTTISTAASNPTMAEFFQAGDPACEFCATFHGDYIAVAYGRDGKANVTWTDMRDPSPFTPGLFSQFIYYARK
jgi:hypothetical protein